MPGILATFFGGILATRGIAAADFNGDGRIDVACTFNSAVAVLLANGPHAWGPTTLYTAGGGARGITTGDFNGDGKPDIAVACNTGNQLAILTNNGIGTSFAAPVPLTTGGGPGEPIACDANHDGRLDLAAVNFGLGTLQSFLSTATNPPAIITQPVSAEVVAGQDATFSITATGGNLSYQWKSNSITIAGATSSSFTIPAATRQSNLHVLSCTVSNACGSVTSDVVALGVLHCPGDFNDDGNVDFFDYLDYVDAFSAGC